VHAIANDLAEKRFPAVFCHVEVPHPCYAPLPLLLAPDRFHSCNIPPHSRNTPNVFYLLGRQLEPQVEEFLHQLLAFFLQLVATESSQLTRFHTTCPQISIRVVKNRVAIGNFCDAKCIASRAISSCTPDIS
jgi:hypothetical protein